MSVSKPLEERIIGARTEAAGLTSRTPGFEVVKDTPLSASKRWVRIRPVGNLGSDILLSRAAGEKQRSSVGNQTGGRVLFFFHTDDFAADYGASQYPNALLVRL